jgi:hypothetical protein
MSQPREPYKLAPGEYEECEMDQSAEDETGKKNKVAAYDTGKHDAGLASTGSTVLKDIEKFAKGELGELEEESEHGFEVK